MRAVALSAGFALLVVAFWFGGVVAHFTPRPTTGLSRDLYAQFYPRYEYGAHALRAARIPLWNPHELCGTPFLADAQSGVLDPLVALAFGLAPGGAGLHVHFLLHFLLTGVATWLFCRAAGVGWQGAALAACAWTFSPALTRSIYHPNRIACLAWLPVIFWAGERLRRAPTLPHAAVLALALAAQAVAGYPEFSLDSLLLLGLALVTHRRAAARGRLLAMLALAALAAALLAAAQLVPSVELVGQSTRAEITARPALVPGTEVLATFFGLERGAGLVLLDMLPALYVGALPLALAVCGALAGRAPLARPFALAALACVLAVVAYRWLHLLPFYRLTRFALAWALLLPFFTAVLAGMGWDDMVRAGGRARAVAAIVLVGVGFLVLGTPVGAAVGVAGMAVLVAAGQWPRWRRPLFAVALLALLVDLFVNLPYWGGTDPFPPLPRSATTRALLAEIDGRPDVRYLGVAESYFGVAATDGLYAITGLSNSAMPRRLARIIDYFNPGIAADMPLRLDRVAGSKPLLDAMAVGYVTGPARWAPALERAGFQPLLAPAGAAHGLWRNPDALPRAFLVRQVRTVAGEAEAFAAVTAAAFRPAVEAILEEPLPTALPAAPLGPDEAARIASAAGERVAVETATAAPALLVLSDTYFPGWEAAVDGTPTSIARADVAFRAVLVPAGRHVVTFTYRPRSFRVGAMASLVGLVLVGAALGSGRRRAVAAGPAEMVPDGARSSRAGGRAT